MRNQKPIARSNQKGFAILVSVFLFMLLSILSLNMAQVIVVDTKIRTEPIAGGFTRHLMGPRKETERLQVYYMALAGIYHARQWISNNPFLTDLPNRINSDDQTSPTVTYVIDDVANATIDTNHTLLADLIIKSEGRTPRWIAAFDPGFAAISTRIELRESYWRSTRAFAQTFSGTNFPVGAIDTSDGSRPYDLDTNYGARLSQQNNNNPMQWGGSWGYDCASNPCPVTWVDIDFGMNVTFDEIRFLNDERDYIAQMTLLTWDDNTGNWVNQGVRNYRIPQGGQFVAYNVIQTWDGQSIGSFGGCTQDQNVYRGDSCSDFMDSNANNVVWEPYTAGAHECIFYPWWSNPCSTLGGMNKNVSYIGRFRLATPVTTRKIRLQVTGNFPASATSGSMALEELGIYSDPDNNENTQNSINRLKETHGRARINSGGGGGGEAANSSNSQNPGNFYKNVVTYE